MLGLATAVGEYPLEDDWSAPGFFAQEQARIDRPSFKVSKKLCTRAVESDSRNRRAPPAQECENRQHVAARPTRET